MNAKILFLVLVCTFSVQASNMYKATRKNLCVEKYDMESRKEAFKCGLTAGVKNEDQDFASIFQNCEKKFSLSEDGQNGFPRLCAEEAKHGGPISACILRTLNPAKVNPASVAKYRKEMDETCFKSFDIVEDTAISQ